MPDIRALSPGDAMEGVFVEGWTKRAFPATVEEYRAGVEAWLALAWPDWHCPHCASRFWIVFEAVKLSAAPEWPVAESSSASGFYPAVPVTCSKCRHMALISLGVIFEPASEPQK